MSHRDLKPSVVTTTLFVTGVFCAPLTSWSLFNGLLLMSDALFLAALGTHATTGIKRLSTDGGVSILLIVSGMLLALSGLIVFALGTPNAEPVNAAKIVFSLCVFPVLIMSIVGTDRAQIHRMLAAWVAGGCLSALVAVASRHGISLLGFRDAAAAAGHRAEGLTYHSNLLGYSSALLIPVSIYLFRVTQRRMFQVLLIGAIAVLLYALQLTGSRSSVVSMLLGLAYPLLRGLRLHTWLYLVLGMVGMLALALLAATLVLELDLHQITERFEESAVGRLLGLSSSGYRSNSERLLYLQASWDHFVEAPLFGAGYGWLRLAHMHVLGILQCGGIFAFFAFLLWLIAIGAASFRVTRYMQVARSLPWPPALRSLVTSGLIIWFVSGALQPLILDRNGYLLVGLLFAMDAHARKRLQGWRPMSPPSMPIEPPAAASPSPGHSHMMAAPPFPFSPGNRR